MDANATSLAAVVIAAVSTLGTVAAAFIAGWVKVRLAQNETQTAKNRRTAARLKRQNKKQAGQIEKLEANSQKCEDEHRATKDKLDKCEEKHEATTTELADIRADVDELKKTKKDRTDAHDALS